MKWIIFIFSFIVSCNTPSLPHQCSILIDGVWISTETIEFGYMNIGKKYMKTIYLYNSSKNKIDINIINEKPEISVYKIHNDSVKLINQDFAILPQTLDSIKINILIHDTSMLGEYCNSLRFLLNGATVLKGINISGIVIDNFDSIIPDLSPKISLTQDTFDFDTITRKNNINVPVIIKNIGNKNLIIRKIEVTCGCTQPKLPCKIIKPSLFC